MSAEDTTVVSFDKLERLEGALGFYPYGDERYVELLDSGDVTVPNDFRVTLLSKLAIDGELAGEDIGHAQALKNLELHTSEMLAQSPLFDYQQEVVHDIKDFLQFPQYSPEGQPIRHGYIKLPTATGKTAIFAHTVNEVSRQIGSITRPLKTLVLVPGRDLVGQVVGASDEVDDDFGAEEIARGFAKFAPEMYVTEYHGGRKDLEGDVVVMTYQSLNKAVSANRLNPDAFDIVIGDEIHRALGQTTRESVTRIMHNKIAIGFSATTEYATNKRVSALMPTEIYRLELREAVDHGYLAPIRALAIATNDTLKALGTGEFKEEELASLIESEWRNKTAINVAREFVAEGQQGIITCLPGEDLKHARGIADRLNLESIVDPNTGRIRNINAQMVHGGMSVPERKKIYSLYENGEIDVLTAVDLLNEGWDSVQAKFLINLRPTTSQVLGVQRLGRILRPTEDGKPATVVEFIDNIDKPGKQLFTFYHAMGEKEVTQNKLYGGPSRPYEPGGELPPSPDLPEDLRKLIASINHSVLDQRIFGNLFDLADRGYKTKNGISEELGIARSTVVKIAETLGITGSLMQARTGHKRIFYSSEEQMKIRTYISEQIPPKAPEGYKSAQSIGDEVGVGREFILGITEVLDIEGALFGFGSGRKNGVGYSIEEQQRIKDYILNSDAPGQIEGYLAIEAFAKISGYRSERLREVFPLLDIELTAMRSSYNRVLGMYLSPEDQSLITNYLEQHGTPRVQQREETALRLEKRESAAISFEHDEYVSLTTIGEVTGWSPTKVSQTARELGIKGAQVSISGRLAKGFNHEERAIIAEKLGQAVRKRATDENLSISGLARHLGVKPRAITNAAKDLEIEGETLRFGAQTTTGYGREEQERIANLVRNQIIPNAPDDYLSLHGIAKLIGNIGDRTVANAIQALGIQGARVKFNGKPAPGYSPAQQEQIIQFLTQSNELGAS